jgi:hypothetical protein
VPSSLSTTEVGGRYKMLTVECSSAAATVLLPQTRLFSNFGFIDRGAIVPSPSGRGGIWGRNSKKHLISRPGA